MAKVHAERMAAEIEGDFARIVDGGIAERWTQFDRFGPPRQIGGIPG